MGSSLHKISVCGLLYLPEKGALILRRSAAETFLTGYYELPGGGVDFEETLEEALFREYNEETGNQIKVLHPYHVFSYLSEDGKTSTVNISYFVEPIGDIGKIALSEEHDRFKWVNSSDLGEIKMTKEMREDINSGLGLLLD